MVPHIFAMRQMVDANFRRTPCGKCRNCSCFQSTSDTSPMYDQDTIEIDPSPMATQQLQYFAETKITPKPSFWDTYCELHSSEPECKIYEA